VGSSEFHLQYHQKTALEEDIPFIQHSGQNPRQNNWAREKNKEYLNWKRESQIVTVYRRHDPKHRKSQRLHKMLLETITKIKQS
jgi:hypothetical protein